MQPKLLPGESVATLPNGNILLTMRNGNSHEFSPEEWEEHQADFHENLEVTAMIDMMLESIKHRQTVQVSEMIDGLLDLRQRAASVEQGFKNAVDSMLKYAAIVHGNPEEVAD